MSADLSNAMPRPWFVDPEDPTAVRQHDVDAPIIAEAWGSAGDPDHKEAKANAALIVLAVNCHDDLIAALRRALSHISDMTIRDELREVLAKTEGDECP